MATDRSSSQRGEPLLCYKLTSQVRCILWAQCKHRNGSHGHAQVHTHVHTQAPLLSTLCSYRGRLEREPGAVEGPLSPAPLTLWFSHQNTSPHKGTRSLIQCGEKGPKAARMTLDSGFPDWAGQSQD